MEARRAQMLAKLNQRHKKSQPSEQSSNGSAGNEFYRDHSAIVGELEQLQNEDDQQDVERKLADWTQRISKLQSLLNATASGMAAYERRKATENLQELQDKLKRIRTQFQPQKRFAFTNIKPCSSEKPKTSIKPASYSNGGSDIVDSAMASSKFSPSANTAIIQGKRNEDTIILSSGDCEGKDVLVLDCQSCTIRILGISVTLHLKRLSNCTILCYPVSTSIFIYDCHQSTFVLACQQLRMHSSTDCDVYLHVTTTAIIEDCQHLRFSPYSAAISDRVEEIFQKSQLDEGKNNWDKVQDFNWLVNNQPSPNWSVLPDDKKCHFTLRLG